jgi:hypothetical protein
LTKERKPFRSSKIFANKSSFLRKTNKVEENSVSLIRKYSTIIPQLPELPIEILGDYTGIGKNTTSQLWLLTLKEC